MAIIKYASGIVKLTNKHQGFTFQNSRSGSVMMRSQANDRNRNTRQINAKVNLMSQVGKWRNITPAQKAAWNLFAFTYPQKAKKRSDIFLTGYQIFLKRNSYCSLNYDVENGFMFQPAMHELPSMIIVPTIDQTHNVIDVTEPYIANFGIIPTPGQWLLLKLVPMAVTSGQFLDTFYSQVQVLNSYVDGLFVSLSLPPHPPDVVISVFLSKPLNPSVSYSGSKTRYMGCFTSKTFLELTDTPDSYLDQAGKIVTVKPDQTGLEFTIPPTGFEGAVTAMSVTGDGLTNTPIKLVNDELSPAAKKYYGTNELGSKGFQYFATVFPGVVVQIVNNYLELTNVVNNTTVYDLTTNWFYTFSSNVWVSINPVPSEFLVHFIFDSAGSITYPCPYALKFTAMINQQANSPTLSTALNTNMTQYQVQTVTADAAGLVTLTGIWL